MRSVNVAAVTTALAALGVAQEGTKYYDPTRGVSFSSLTQPNGVTFRIAMPENSTAADAIYQIVAPNDFAWCGTGQKAIVSSRMAFGYYATPGPYEGAMYTYLPGTTTNATHWQLTARCQGCTQWSSTDGDFNLNNETYAILAYTCSSMPPDDKTSNTSMFNVHEQFGIWSHDLTIAKNASFSEWVKGNFSMKRGQLWSA